MAKLLVTGGTKLTGTVRVSGNKNAALKLLAAALLAKGKTTLTNVPDIHDITVMYQVLEELGCSVAKPQKGTLVIDPSGLNTHIVSKELSGRIRTAPLLIAPLLLKFGKAEITTHGGCSIGYRLLSTHFAMLEALGAKVAQKDGGFKIAFDAKPVKRDVFLEEASVTATELGLILAAGLPSETIISDAACEPHIEDLAAMLTAMGAKVIGAGTNTITITGSTSLKGVTHAVSPDHVEAGTWAIAAATTGGHVKITGARARDLRMIRAYLAHFGVQDKFVKDTWEIMPSDLVFDGKVKEFQTRPWPGFPTDLMSPLIVLATQTKQPILLHDWMFEWRMFFVDELIKMGAKMVIADTHRVISLEPKRLKAEKLVCKDIRAGMAVLIAALSAKGTSEIDKVEVIERGYEDLLEKFQGLGAQMSRVD